MSLRKFLSVVHNTLPVAAQGAADFFILTACGLMPPAPQSSGSRFPMFCCLGVHWASWLAPGWSWGSMFCSLGGSWGSWFAPGWSLGSMFSIAYRYCTSSFHMFIAYLYRISLLRIFIAYVYCISLLHISVAYLYCISILHISVAVLLSFVA